MYPRDPPAIVEELKLKPIRYLFSFGCEAKLLPVLSRCPMPCELHHGGIRACIDPRNRYNLLVHDGNSP